MTSERHQRVKQLFNRVAELDASDRAQVLDDACGEDDDLRREVLELLAHLDRSRGKPLERVLASRDEGSGSPPSPRQIGRDGAHGRFLPGAMLGSRYRIVGLLGRGGMGEVYRADDLELGQSVALKFLPPSAANKPNAIERFRREVRVAREVAHVNVCRVYDIGQLDGHVFLSMEFVDGDDLAHVLKQLGRPSPEKAVDLARQVCLGVAAAHERGVLHRDLKPANIMIDGRGGVRITDFGLAGLVDELTGSSERAGTPAYMAPEQLGEGKVSVRSDIYSLGLLLYELFTGRPAFEGESFDEILRARSSGSITSITSILADVDPAVERAIDRCLSEDPAERPSSAYAVLGSLPGGDPIAAAIAAGETPSPDLVANATDRGGMRPALAVSALAAVIACSLFVARTNEAMIAFPQQPPHVVSVLARQLLLDLGYDELPAHEAEGFEVNHVVANRKGETKPRDDAVTEGWPPPYRFWRRWSHHEIVSTDFHTPEAIRLDQPPRALPGEVSVVLDPDTGNLLELFAVPEPTTVPAARSEFEWQRLLEAAGIGPGRARPSTEPAPATPSFCDAVRVWDVERAAGRRFRAIAATSRGRPVYFRLLGATASEPPPDELPDSFVASMSITWAAIFFLAIRNWRLGRGDRRNALRFAAAIAIAYALLEMLAVRARGESLLHVLGRIIWWESGGHIALHTIQMLAAYLAIEPFVRRFWPRLLVGWVRLMSGRVRDPMVGRELLVGAVAGALLSTLACGARWYEHLSGDRLPSSVLDNSSVGALSSHTSLVTSVLHNFVGSVFLQVLLVGILVILRIVFRARWLTILLVTVALLMLSPPAGDLGIAGYVVKAVEAVVIVWLLTHVGMLSAAAAMVCVTILAGPISADLSAWHSPWTLMVFAVVFGIAGYGCWLALAGRPILRDPIDGSRLRAAT